MSKRSGKSTRPKTRHASGSNLQDYVGAGKEFDPTKVPTLRAMIQQGIFLRDQKFLFEDVAKNAPSYSKKQIAKDLAPMILAQWHKSRLRFCGRGQKMLPGGGKVSRRKKSLNRTLISLLTLPYVPTLSFCVKRMDLDVKTLRSARMALISFALVYCL